MHELQKKLAELEVDFLKTYEKLKITEKAEQVTRLEKEVAEPDIWKNVEEATNKNQELKRKMHAFIKRHYASQDKMPSVSELANEFHVAKSTAHAYLIEMDEDHIISYRDGKIELDKKDKVRNRKELTSLVGYACCG